MKQTHGDRTFAAMPFRRHMPVATMLLASSLLALALVSSSAHAQSGTSAILEETRWPALKSHFFGEREIVDGRGTLSLVAPERAFDASLVPVTVRANFAQSDARYVKTITLLIDNNPAPLAGRFHLTPASGKADLSTRMRVNEPSHVRAIAELNDGSLHMVKRYVRAAGGCTAPAPGDPEATMARMGKMRLKRPATELLGQPNRAKLMIAHPNYSGMQMDARTQQYIPADFVREIEVRHAGELVMRIESDISISEDPSFQFYYSPVASGDLSVSVFDTAQRHFETTFEAPPNGGATSKVASD